MNMSQSNHKIIKIALVDDHILLRDALASVIDRFDNCQVIALAGHGNEFIGLLQKGTFPDLVLLDLEMPELDGYETAKYMRANYPQIHVLVLTMYDSELAMIRFLQTGVRGFLKKDIHPSELKLAIETTMNSGYYYSGHSTGKLVNLLKHGESNIPLVNAITLTESELRFLKLACTELTYREIAQKMKISPRTVDYFRDTLFAKLNVKSRVGLVLYAIKNGVIRLNY